MRNSRLLTVSTEAGTARTVRGMYATALQFPKIDKYELDNTKISISVVAEYLSEL